MVSPEWGRKRERRAHPEESLPKHTAHAYLTPAERLDDIPAIFAAGILRLETRPESPRESTRSGGESGAEGCPNCPQKRLHLPGRQEARASCPFD